MKYLIGILSCVFLSGQLVAQFDLVDQGPLFKEVEAGQGKILLLKDGTTFLITAQKGDVNIRIYDPSRKEIAAKKLAVEFPKSYAMETLFEFEGDIVLMVTETVNKVTALVRYRINPKNGDIVERKELASLPKRGAGNRLAIYAGHLDAPQFLIRQDPGSEHYAVARFNTLEADRSKRLEIIHYGPAHAVIGQSYFRSPDEKYKYLEYIDMAVIGGRQVSILVHAYNTKASGGEERNLFLGSLDAGKAEIAISKLGISHYLWVHGGTLRYNPVSQKLIVLANLRDEKNDGYIPFIAYVHPFEHKIEYTGLAIPANADETSKQLFGEKKGFTGLPQNLYLYEDGSFSILFEEMRLYHDGKTTSTVVGNAVVGYYNILGHPTGSYFIPKYRFFVSERFGSFYLSRTENGFCSFNGGDQFKTLYYLKGKAGTFVLLNDPAVTESQVKNGKVPDTYRLADCNTYAYKLDGDNQVPGRTLVFPVPAVSGFRPLFSPEIADYDKGANILVTLQLDRSKKDRQVRVVWVRPS